MRWAEQRFPVSSWHLPSKLAKHSLQLPCVRVCVFVWLYLNACTVVYVCILCAFLKKTYLGHISLPNQKKKKVKRVQPIISTFCSVVRFWLQLSKINPQILITMMHPDVLLSFFVPLTNDSNYILIIQCFPTVLQLKVDYFMYFNTFLIFFFYHHKLNLMLCNKFYCDG